jgi:RimJ/RimL family protein N-acetyltransferase
LENACAGLLFSRKTKKRNRFMHKTVNEILQPTLVGPRLTVRPLIQSDWQALYDVASDPLIWEQHPNPSMHEVVEFRKYFDGGIASQSAFAVVDHEANLVIGTSRYYDAAADFSSVAIGFTFLARSHWGNGANKELKALMIDHALKHFGKVCFQIAQENMRSRKAIEKIGATQSSEFKKVIYGKELDYCLYDIARENWRATQ